MEQSAKQEAQANSQPPQTSLEKFLTAVEAKTHNEVHLRLLKAARQSPPAAALDTAFRSMILEIINEA